MNITPSILALALATPAFAAHPEECRLVPVPGSNAFYWNIPECEPPSDDLPSNVRKDPPPADDPPPPPDDDPVDPDDPPEDRPKNNRGHGNGDEGDCRGAGCTDPDNPGRGGGRGR